MLQQFKKAERTAIDDEIKSVLDMMNREGPNSPEYPKLMTALERLNKLKTQERPERVSRDTLWMVGGNLVGIVLIVSYERMNVITSKAFAHIPMRSRTT